MKNGFKKSSMIYFFTQSLRKARDKDVDKDCQFWKSCRDP